MESNGGEISLDSNNTGCSITLTFPTNITEARLIVEGFVVVVDDDDEVLEIFARQLKDYKNKTITTDPKNAIAELTRKTGPITVISDLIFSDSDLIGFDILRASPSSSRRYLYSTLGSEASVISLAAKENVVVIDKAKIPVLVLSKSDDRKG